MKEFIFTGDTQNGILKYFHEFLTETEYYNEITTSSYPQHGTPQRAIDFNNDTYWHGQEKMVGSYLVISIKSYYVKIKGFSITSSNLNPGIGICHPKNWGFDASNDKINWHHQVNYTDTNNDMNKRLASAYFEWDFGTFKHFRIMNTGEQHDGQGKLSMDLSQIEFFGTLITNPIICTPYLKTCLTPRHHILFLIPLIKE